MGEIIKEEIVKMAEECIKRWEISEKEKSKLEIKIEKWLSKSTPEQQDIFLVLLKHFSYYSKHRTLEIFKKMINEYRANTPNNQYQIFTDIKSQNPNVNSSSSLLNEIYEYMGDINKYAAITNIKPYFVGKEFVKEVVLLDDFIGSGKTVIDYMKDNIKYLRSKRVVIIVVEILEESIQRIEEWCKSQSIQVEIIYYAIQKKAFSDNYIFNSDVVGNNKSIIKDLETQLWNKSFNKQNILGYDDSECLLAFWRNTPNNTLSSFWYEERDTWYGLFPRKDKAETTPTFVKLFQQKKAAQKRMNYNLGKQKGVVNGV